MTPPASAESVAAFRRGLMSAMTSRRGISRGRNRFHSLRNYRRYQHDVAERAVLPFLRRFGVDIAGRRLLDLGCGNAGMTSLYREKGAVAVGIDRDWGRMAGAPGLLVAGDALNLPFKSGSFELVIAHDLVEHVCDVAMVLREIGRVLSQDGLAFVSFPPFFGPYGGHQQGARGPARLLPFGHLLPEALWLSLVSCERYHKMFGGLGRLSISEFDRAVKHSSLAVARRQLHLVRPEVALRLGLPVIECGLFCSLPVVGEFITGGAFYLLSKPGASNGF